MFIIPMMRSSMQSVMLSANFFSLLKQTSSLQSSAFPNLHCVSNLSYRSHRRLDRLITGQCEVLEQAGVKNVLYPHTPPYTDRVHSYWSLTSQLTPSCFVQPENSTDVSLILQSLFEQKDCKFAVRSGGHSSNPGANNIEEGVTIDLGTTIRKCCNHF